MGVMRKIKLVNNYGLLALHEENSQNQQKKCMEISSEK